MKELKKIPKFKSEDEERRFWAKHDSTDYIDWEKGEQTIFSNLKPTSHSISIRMPDYLINRLKQIANKKDIPYQSLIKAYLFEKIKEEV